MNLARLVRQLAPFHARSHDCLYGVPGSGKTELAKALAAALRRVWFFDATTRDYGSEGERCTVADLRDPLLVGGTFARVVVIPGHDQARDFKAFIAAAREEGKRRPLFVVCDEVGNYAPRCTEELMQLHCNGHHDGVTSLLVSQFAVQVPKTCRRSASRVLSLLQDLEDDLSALASDYGEAFASTVRAWQPGDPPAVWTRRTLYQQPTKAHRAARKEAP